MFRAMYGSQDMIPVFIEALERVAEHENVTPRELVRQIERTLIEMESDHSYDEDEHKPTGMPGFHDDPNPPLQLHEGYDLPPGAHPKQYPDGRWCIVNRSEAQYWSISYRDWRSDVGYLATVGYFDTAEEAVADFQKALKRLGWKANG